MKFSPAKWRGPGAAASAMLLACALGSCDRSEPEVAAKPAELAEQKPAAKPDPTEAADPAEPTDPAEPPDPAAHVLPPEPPPRPYPSPGWTRFLLVDQVPICAFQNYPDADKVKFLSEAKGKTKLAAGSTMVIGAYGPGCVSELCTERPLIQCWIDREGETLVVHSRYSGANKDGSKCTENCRRMTAACESPVLDAGKYTIRYGERTFPLKIPSVLRSPCFKLD